MTWETWFAFGVLAAVFAGLVRGYAPDAMLAGGMLVCGLAGIVSPRDMLSGFCNEGMLTVAALYIVAAALRETGALSILGRFLLGRSRTETGVMGRMALMVPALSAFLNNTPIVAMFLPVILEWCRNHKAAPSRFLIPLSYFAILGGTCTLIGTSTNLVVSGLMADRFRDDPQTFAGLYPVGFFEISVVGIPYALIGVAYLLLAGKYVLPHRADPDDLSSLEPREYLVNMRIESGCRLAGKSVEGAGLRHLSGLFLVEISRGGELISPVSPGQILRAGDVLTFTGVVETIVDLQRIPGLTPMTDAELDRTTMAHRETLLCEAVVSPSSPIAGQNIRDSDFRALYNAVVIAVHRGGARLKGRVGDIVLRAGDTLLLQAGAHFTRAHRNNPDFYLVGGVEDSHQFRHDKAALSLALLAALVFLMASNFVPIVIAAFLVAGLLVATRCISVADARKSLDLQTLIAIAASFGLGEALVKAGCVDVVTETIVRPLGAMHPALVVAGVYLMTSCVTELITNNAAAALMFPFAVEFALKMDINPRTLCVAVMFAASASFITPIGYQTNLMVYGPGKYRFTDYFRAGLPLHLALFVTAVILIPWYWPL